MIRSHVFFDNTSRLGPPFALNSRLIFKSFELLPHGKTSPYALSKTRRSPELPFRSSKYCTMSTYKFEPLTILESALAEIKDLKSIRISTCKKNERRAHIGSCLRQCRGNRFESQTTNGMSWIRSRSRVCRRLT